MILNYDHNHSFIVLATVIMIVNYNFKIFIVQATGVVFKTLPLYVTKGSCTLAKFYGENISDSDSLCACLGHLGRQNTLRIVPGGQGNY
jgi:hypothetical protein